MATTPTYSITLISKIMGVDEHTIRRLARSGVLTRPIVRGQWPITIVAEYIAHMREQTRDSIDHDAAIAPAAAAELLCMTPRRLRQLAADGVIPKVDHGKYLVIGSVQGYVDYLQHLKTGTDEYQAESKRLTSARADTYELELAVKQRRLYAADDVDQTLFKVCTQLTAMLDGSASRIARQLGGGATLRTKLVDEFREIRSRFASDLREFSGSIRNLRDADRASAKPRAGKVGKRKKSTAARQRRAR